MGVEFASERRLLAEEEIAQVVRSHFPGLEDLARAELIDLMHWLRTRHGRAQGIIRDRRRVRSGKAEARGTAADTASERGLADKKQVFARAMKRVNGRLNQLRTEEKRAATTAHLRAALARRQPATHPEAGTTTGGGMRPLGHRKPRMTINPARIGSVSQAGKRAQARRDG